VSFEAAERLKSNGASNKPRGLLTSSGGRSPSALVSGAVSADAGMGLRKKEQERSVPNTKSNDGLVRDQFDTMQRRLEETRGIGRHKSIDKVPA